MASDQDSLKSHNPDEQFARLQSWCRQSAPAFYADQAHYLLVLRENLATAVHRSLADWLCSLEPDRLGQLSDQERESLQARIDQLVQRCSALLTIEQLQLLAKNLARERKLRRRQAQQAMVEALQRSTDASEDDSTDLSSAPTPELGGVAGSVNLSFAPPIDQPALLEGLIAPIDSGDGEQDHELDHDDLPGLCLLYTSPSPRDKRQSRMPSSA